MLVRDAHFWDWFDRVARPRLSLRRETFAAIFARLDQVDGPVTIVETGCVRRADNWQGDGQSTILFDRYVSRHPGSLVWSVDADPVATAFCAHMVSGRVALHTADGATFLAALAGPGSEIRRPVDLLYLDSADDPAVILAELEAALPLLSPASLIVVDDSPTVDGQVTGKGAMVAERLAGAEAVFAEYQVGWTGFKQER